MSEFNQNNKTGNYGNSGNQISISTSMMSIWDSGTGAQLKLSILNNGLSIAIWLPFVNPDGTRKYPTENRFSTVLSQKNALAMERVITDYIIPAYEKGVNHHAGIFTNSSRSNMVEIEVRDGDFYFLMHRNCDPVSRIPKDTIRFKFESAAIIDGYDSVTGEMNVVPIHADFFVFAKAIYAYNSLAAGTIAAHGNSIASNNMNQRFMEYVRAIADAVHAQLPAPTYQQTTGGYRQPNNARPNNGYGAPQGVPAVQSVVTTEVNSLSDLLS